MGGWVILCIGIRFERELGDFERAFVSLFCVD